MPRRAAGSRRDRTTAPAPAAPSRADLPATPRAPEREGMPPTSGFRVRRPAHHASGTALQTETPPARPSAAATTATHRAAATAANPAAPARPTLQTWLQRWRTRRLGAQDRATFARQLATLVGGGLPPATALTLLATQTPHERAARAARRMARRIHSGSTLADALACHPELCTPLQTAIVRAGETGPFRDRALHDAADLVQREADLRARIDATLAYPTVVLSVVLGIILAMLLLVVPTFGDLYRSLHTSLPVTTRLLLGAATVTSRALPLAVLLAAAAAILTYRRLRTPEGRLCAARMLLRVPALGALIRHAALARFARATSALLRSGMPLPAALETVAAGGGNPVVAHAAADAATAGPTSGDIAARLRAHPVIPPALAQPFETPGEPSERRAAGSPDRALRRLADTYDDEVTTAIATHARRVEPVLLAIMGTMVAVIIVALYLPLFGIIDLSG